MSRQKTTSVAARRGFTIIELLVVMVIIALLSGLLLAGVQRAREAARRTQTLNNLKQIQLAVANYEAQFGYYPPSWKPTIADASGNINGWSIHALLLPYLEQGRVVSNIDFDQSYGLNPMVKTADGREIQLSALRVPSYISPVEKRDEQRIEGGVAKHYPLNYVANCGVWHVYDPATGAGGSGPFYPNSRIAPAAVSDGLSYTLGFAEVKAWQAYFRNAQKTDAADILEPVLVTEAATLSAKGGEFKDSSGHTEWVDGRVHQVGFTTAFPPNTKCEYTHTDGLVYDVDWTNQQEGKSTTVKTVAAITARSYHDGGVHVSMLDGSVRFVPNTINLGVWRAYSTRAGGELMPSDENLAELLPETEEEEEEEPPTT